MEKVDPEAADVFTAFPVQVWAHLSNPGFGTLFQSRFLPSPGLMLLYKEVLFSVPCSLCTYQGWGSSWTLACLCFCYVFLQLENGKHDTEWQAELWEHRWNRDSVATFVDSMYVHTWKTELSYLAYIISNTFWLWIVYIVLCQPHSEEHWLANGTKWQLLVCWPTWEVCVTLGVQRLNESWRAVVPICWSSSEMKSMNRMVECKWCVCFDVYWLYSAVSLEGGWGWGFKRT